VKKILSIIRLKEIIGKTGFFLVGVLFAHPSITSKNIFIGVEFFCLCILNGISIYLINAGFGYANDRDNLRLKNMSHVSSKTLWISGFVLLSFSLLLLTLFCHDLLLPALGVYTIWILYSMPRGLKGVPLLGLICAFTAQLLHFYVGYRVFSEWSQYSFAVAIYFSFLFAAGHALHEVIDFDADHYANIRTSAVVFGRRKLWIATHVLFTIAFAYLILITIAGVISWKVATPYALAFALQCWLFIRLPSVPGGEELFGYRRKYMIAWLFATVAVAVSMYAL
jgi:4-hydroxybenzoate polyprenyltransferase